MGRQTVHCVKIDGTGEVFSCKETESVLAAMARLGRRGIPLGCRGGGCGVCKVQVVEGDYERIAAMSHTHVSDRDLAEGRVLACRIAPLDDLVIRVVAGMKKAFSK